MSTLRGGFDRGLGGSAEATAGMQYAALAQAAAELARAWASAQPYVEPDPLNYPGLFSAYHYALIAMGGQWFRGPGVPSALLGENGNYYLDEVTGDLYQKVSDVWVLVLNIKGPTGATGATGPQGPAGSGGAVALDDLTDVTITSPVTDQVLKYNGSVWVNGTGGGGGGGAFTFAASAPSTPAVGDQWMDSVTGVTYTYVNDGTSNQWIELGGVGPGNKYIQVACSDETTALTAGTNKITFRMPHAMTLVGIRASLTTAQTSGNIFTVDINENGVSILSTKLTIDNGEKTSVTAATSYVASDTSLADDSEITVDIDQIGDGTAKGLKITLIGT